MLSTQRFPISQNRALNETDSSNGRNWNDQFLLKKPIIRTEKLKNVSISLL